MLQRTPMDLLATRAVQKLLDLYFRKRAVMTVFIAEDTWSYNKVRELYCKTT